MSPIRTSDAVRHFLLLAVALVTGVLAATSSPSLAAGGSGPLVVALAEIEHDEPSRNKPAKSAIGRFPAVGVMLSTNPAFAGDGQYFDFEQVACTVTLIGCSQVLTAAHCFGKPTEQRNEDPNTRLDRFRVFFQHRGLFDVAAISPMPRLYENCEEPYHDLALVTLAEPVDGIALMPVSGGDSPTPGVKGTLVGFGNFVDGQRPRGSGIKRTGAVELRKCDANAIDRSYKIDKGIGANLERCGRPESFLLCWDFVDAYANQCSGDSGGPLLVEGEHGDYELAGTAVWGKHENCGPGDHTWDMDVSKLRVWLEDLAGGALEAGTAECGNLPDVRPELVATWESPANEGGITRIGSDTSGGVEVDTFKVAVPGGMKKVVFSVNSSARFGHWSLRADHATSNVPVRGQCKDERGSGAFASCSVNDPEHGDWLILITKKSFVRDPSTDMQLTVTFYPG